MRSLQNITINKNAYRKSFELIKITKDFVDVTNGHVLVRIPTEELFSEIDQSLSFPIFVEGKQWKAVSNKLISDLKLTSQGIEGHKKDGSKIMVSFTQCDETYPDFNYVLPNENNLLQTETSISFNVKLLNQVVDGLGTDLLEISFYGNYKYVIKPVEETGLNGVAVLMGYKNL